MPALIAALAALALAAGHSAPATSAARWRPPPHLTWYWQLQGRVNNHVNAAAYDVDGFDTSASEVARLHALGRHVICYIDVGTWENWRPDARGFPRRLLGRPDGWPGERWLDIRALRALKPIMTARFRMCARKGFDALEPDNIEVAGQHSGFRVTRAQQLRYAKWVAGEAHRLGLAVLQKNDPGQSRALEPYFDGALVEQCNQYSECGAYRPYLRAGKPVLGAEYLRRLFPHFCAADRRAGIMAALFNLALNGRRFRPCWGSG